MYIPCRLIMLFISKINCSVGSVPVHQFSLMLMFSKRFFFFFIPLEVL